MWGSTIALAVKNFFHENKYAGRKKKRRGEAPKRSRRYDGTPAPAVGGSLRGHSGLGGGSRKNNADSFLAFGGILQLEPEALCGKTLNAICSR